LLFVNYQFLLKIRYPTRHWNGIFTPRRDCFFHWYYGGNGEGGIEMSPEPECKPSVRLMYEWEIREASKVFAASLDYARVRVHECTSFTNSINKIGNYVKKLPQTNVPNAVTLGNHCYFPVRLLTEYVEPGHSDEYKIWWLVHELTHAWQYQHLGWTYILRALNAQLREKEGAYKFGGREGLIKSRAENKTFLSFNMEAQGEITSSYYRMLTHQEDVSAWIPFIEDLKRVP
jgi:hypothetical protein